MRLVVLGTSVDCAVDPIVVEILKVVLREADVVAKIQNKTLINMILGRVRTVFDLRFCSKRIYSSTTSIDS